MGLQKKHGVSIFQCGGWDVFSDAAVEIGDGYYTQKVNDAFGEFHRVKRKTSGTWVNWGLFYQVWLQVRYLGKWESKSWTVKVEQRGLAERSQRGCGTSRPSQFAF